MNNNKQYCEIFCYPAFPCFNNLSPFQNAFSTLCCFALKSLLSAASSAAALDATSHRSLHLSVHGSHRRHLKKSEMLLYDMFLLESRCGWCSKGLLVNVTLMDMNVSSRTIFSNATVYLTKWARVANIILRKTNRNKTQNHLPQVPTICFSQLKTS